MEYTSSIQNAIQILFVIHHQNNYDGINHDGINHVLLPISDTSGNVKCLDFDIDKANFNSFPSLLSLFTDSKETKDTKAHVVLPRIDNRFEKHNKNINKDFHIIIDKDEQLHLPLIHNNNNEERNLLSEKNDEIICFPICDIV